MRHCEHLKARQDGDSHIWHISTYITLGVILDNDMTMSQHVLRVLVSVRTQNCYFQITSSDLSFEKSLNCLLSSGVATIFRPSANNLFGPLSKGLRRLLLPDGPLAGPSNPAAPPPWSRGLRGPRYAIAVEYLFWCMQVSSRLSFWDSVLACLLW